MTEYRAVPDEYEPAYQEIVNYAFRLHEGPLGPDADEHLYPSFGERRGLFVDDELRCICRHYFLDTSIRGGQYTMGGYTVIASPPEHRRKGYVSDLTVATLEEYRERDVHVAALWPFSYGFYRYFGWGVANNYATYECPPSALAFSAEAETGTFRRLSPDDYELLEPVLAAHGEASELAIERPEGWWHGRTFARHGRDRYVYAFERDGEIGGYLAYTVEELETVDEMGHGKTQLQVHDMAWVDQEAYLNLLRLLFNHDSQVDSVQIVGPADMTLLDLVDEPESVDVSVHPGGMFRLVDVAGAIEMLDYPDAIEGRVVLGVDDEHAAWNDGMFAIEVGNGSATCEPVEEGEEIPDGQLDVSRLSQLYVGARSISALELAGHADVSSQEAAGLLDAMYPESKVYLREFF